MITKEIAQKIADEVDAIGLELANKQIDVLAYAQRVNILLNTYDTTMESVIELLPDTILSDIK